MQKDLPAQFQLDDKVALVTGAIKGLVEALAWGMARFDAKVVVSSSEQPMPPLTVLAGSTWSTAATPRANHDPMPA